IRAPSQLQSITRQDTQSLPVGSIVNLPARCGLIHFRGRGAYEQPFPIWTPDECFVLGRRRDDTDQKGGSLGKFGNFSDRLAGGEVPDLAVVEHYPLAIRTPSQPERGQA